ncbi:MAG: glycosyl hydrolase, partial [Bacteroidia bacterium]|nr:glycosyl hydrolase [Bacteroidia bacterium]
NSFMLQQWKFIADIIYYYGEDNNITALFRNKLPDIPDGFNYDFVNADALVNLLSVTEGKIITPGGMSYRLLALDPNSQNLSLPVLLKIRSLVENGAIIAGPKPIQSPSLSDDQTVFQSVVNELWPPEKGEKSFGKGKVFTGQTIAGVMTVLQIAPDFDYTKPDAGTNLLFVHRKLAKADIYWVNNRNNREEKLEATFRIEGKIPEIWQPVTGKTGEASYVIEKGVTRVALNLEPNDAVNADTGVKYFSGTATYTKTINVPGNWLKKGEHLWLDLGIVRNLADVAVNGKSLGIIWKKPFRIEVTDVLKPGENQLEIKVTNLWVNRLIGDQQPDVAKKYTYTTQSFYRADSPLLPSGLLGPVQIVSLSEN